MEWGTLLRRALASAAGAILVRAPIPRKFFAVLSIAWKLAVGRNADNNVNILACNPERLRRLADPNRLAAAAVPLLIQPVSARRVHVDTREKPVVFVKWPEGS
jgi:hypothetical protein